MFCLALYCNSAQCRARVPCVPRSVGVYFPAGDTLNPTTPAPDFNLDDCLKTISKLREFDIETILFSHFGPARDVPRIFDLAIDKLNTWARLALAVVEGRSESQDFILQLGAELKEQYHTAPDWLNEQLGAVFAAGYLHYFRGKG